MRFKKKKHYQKLLKRIIKKISIGKKKSRKFIFLPKRKNKLNSLIQKILLIKNIFRPKKSKLEKKARIILPSIVGLLLTICIFSFRPRQERLEIVENINYDFMHGAATGRDFLFGETGSDSIITLDEEPEIETDPIQDNLTGEDNNITSGTNNTTQLFTGSLNPQTGTSNVGISANSLGTGGVIISGNKILLPKQISQYIIKKLREQIKKAERLKKIEEEKARREQAKLYQGTSNIVTNIAVEKINIDCTTPRNTTVKNGEFVLAYQQREDIPHICNVEKRYCINGILQGKLSQSECNENIKYEYEEIQPTTSVVNPMNEYVQTNKPINGGAEFSTDGKINQENISSTDLSYSPNGTQIKGSREVSLTSTTNPQDCRAPRGDTVKNGQFVTAYKAPLGFIDLECKSEFRYCTDGKLGGSFSYKACRYNDVTYNDYLVGNVDIDKPTALDLAESISPTKNTDTENIWTKIQSLFR